MISVVMVGTLSLERWRLGASARCPTWSANSAVHEYDALAAVGREADWSIDPALAWDGVDEVVRFCYPRQVRLERIRPLPGTLRLVPHDVVSAPLEIGRGDPVAELTGPSSYLLLALWKRVPVEDPVAAALLQTAVTP